MRRLRRTVEVFTVSAIDLFAGAMGAFAIMVVLLFPSYLMISKVPPDYQKIIDDLKKQNKDLQDANKELKKQLEDARVTVFLGLATKADSFVLLVDMSYSMRNYTELMTRTVRDMLGKLQDHQRLQIIGFQGKPPSVNLPQWQSGLVPATRANTTSAAAFVDSLSRQFDGFTPTFEALSKALETDAEAIILLSDGEPNDDRTPSQIVSEITTANGGRKHIYTVALGDYDKLAAFTQFMQALARENKGDYIGISR